MLLLFYDKIYCIFYLLKYLASAPGLANEFKSAKNGMPHFFACSLEFENGEVKST